MEQMQYPEQYDAECKSFFLRVKENEEGWVHSYRAMSDGTWQGFVNGSAYIDTCMKDAVERLRSEQPEARLQECNPVWTGTLVWRFGDVPVEIHAKRTDGRWTAGFFTKYWGVNIEKGPIDPVPLKEEAVGDAKERAAAAINAFPPLDRSVKHRRTINSPIQALSQDGTLRTLEPSLGSLFLQKDRLNAFTTIDGVEYSFSYQDALLNTTEWSGQ